MHQHDFDSFVENLIWKEIVITLKEVIAGLHEDISSLLPFGEEAVRLAQQQGRLKMAEYVLQLPADMLREIKDNKNREEKKDA